MSDLVECGFMWERGKRIHGDFATVGEALNIAVHLLKRAACDVQRSERRVDVKAGNRRSIGVVSLAITLADSRINILH